MFAQLFEEDYQYEQSDDDEYTVVGRLKGYNHPPMNWTIDIFNGFVTAWSNAGEKLVSYKLNVTLTPIT